ncbi:MAG: hypothetical protein ACREE5_12585 [Acetobacteraceae bacterium]
MLLRGGDQLGRRWQDDPKLQALLHHADVLIGVLIVAGLAWFLWRRLGHNR